MPEVVRWSPRGMDSSHPAGPSVEKAGCSEKALICWGGTTLAWGLIQIKRAQFTLVSAGVDSEVLGWRTATPLAFSKKLKYS